MLKNAAGHAMRGDAASRFLAKLERMRTCIDEEERLLSLFERQVPKPLSEYGGMDLATHDVLLELAPTKDAVRTKLFVHYRVFERMCRALSAAIRRIPESTVRDYLVWHYLYQFTHEVIAEVMNYSVRQIYRLAARSRVELSRALKIPPQAKPAKFKRFRVVKRLKKCKLKKAG
ncbi:MAG: sigma-70 family RNA polymerase sigma factor [Clostridia bacterium]|nr:sigma-70 family RNA polymerase sigma factor [Clostridia bacterium]